MQTMIYGEMRRWADTISCFHVQKGQALAIGVEKHILHSEFCILRSFYQYCLCAIFKQYTGLTVLIIYHRRHLICPNHNYYCPLNIGYLIPTH